VTVQHIVLFNFPSPLSAQDEATMREMVASWPSEIGLMGKCRFGTDLTGVRNQGYTHLLYTEFDDVETLERYRAHPAHVRFSDWVLGRGCTVLVFDYHLDEGTVLMREPEGRGAAWTEERGTSDEGRGRLKGAPEASGEAQPEPDPATRR
jgi:hypothetical protein